MVVVFVSVLGLDDVVVRRIDVGVTIGAGTSAVGGGWVVIVTGKNVDPLRSDVVDEFGDNAFKWYKWRFKVCVGLAGIKMWWVVGISGIGDDVNGRNDLFPVKNHENLDRNSKIFILMHTEHVRCGKKCWNCDM